jgi:hypothetical protein
MARKTENRDRRETHIHSFNQRSPVAASISLNRGSSTRSGAGTLGSGPGELSSFSMPFTLKEADRSGGEEGVEESFNGGSLMGGDDEREWGTDIDEGSACSELERCAVTGTSENGRLLLY